MFFTCEVHREKFSTLQALKDHDALYHSEDKPPASVKLNGPEASSASLSALALAKKRKNGNGRFPGAVARPPISTLQSQPKPLCPVSAAASMSSTVRRRQPRSRPVPRPIPITIKREKEDLFPNEGSEMQDHPLRIKAEPMDFDDAFEESVQEDCVPADSERLETPIPVHVAQIKEESSNLVMPSENANASDGKTKKKINTVANNKEKAAPLFPCKLCNQSFSSRARHLNHLISDHANEEVLEAMEKEDLFSSGSEPEENDHLDSDPDFTADEDGSDIETADNTSESGLNIFNSAKPKQIMSSNFTKKKVPPPSRLKQSVKIGLGLLGVPLGNNTVCSYLPRVVVCYFCDYIPHPLRIHNFYSHIASHTGERPYAYNICNKQCQNLEDLTQHKESHKGEKRSRKHECGICKNRFVEKSTLRRHMLTHSAAKPHACPHCSSSFKRPGSLRRHVTSAHMKEVPIKCAHCWRGFKRADLFNLHMKTSHPNQKLEKDRPEIRCDICGNIFEFQGLFERHMRVAHADAPFSHTNKCTNCNKSFFTKEYLESHIRMCTISKELKFNCRICVKENAPKRMRLFHSIPGFVHHLTSRHSETKEDSEKEVRRQLEQWKRKEDRLKNSKVQVKSEMELDLDFDNDNHFIEEDEDFEFSFPSVLVKEEPEEFTPEEQDSDGDREDNSEKSPKKMDSIQAENEACISNENANESTATSECQASSMEIEDTLQCSMCHGRRFQSQESLQSHITIFHS